MTRNVLSILLMAVVGSLFLSAAEDGPALFETHKCARCHSIDALEVKSTNKNPDKVKDLSKAGADFENRDAVVKYLKKEVERNEALHKGKFKGEDSELEAIADWILTLK